ncbi:YokU family protein [Neobacillus sp. PS3-12]|jgi:uncharacterized YokU family protein|uniref:YokU family protein n=1 Tax=Neobacillus sp. PS3-12 TaxID=3070677 RepID=UPI0027E1F3E7|nr:YokU family protein [Neobacillus sp. PS3-12]WML53779.1 YokU family protein [Neobacillus sp. PS3-12]
MKVICDWCESQNVEESKESVFWELPDGTRAIEISETPTIVCHDCQIYYQPDNIVKNIEDQLFLVDTKKIGKSIRYEDLMNMPRLLKKNYFDFTQW